MSTIFLFSVAFIKHNDLMLWASNTRFYVVKLVANMTFYDWKLHLVLQDYVIDYWYSTVHFHLLTIIYTPFAHQMRKFNIHVKYYNVGFGNAFCLAYKIHYWIRIRFNCNFFFSLCSFSYVHILISLKINMFYHH